MGKKSLTPTSTLLKKKKLTERIINLNLKLKLRTDNHLVLDLNAGYRCACFVKILSCILYFFV